MEANFFIVSAARGRCGAGAARCPAPPPSAQRSPAHIPALPRAGRWGLRPRLTASAAAAPPRSPWAGEAEEASPELGSVLHPQRPAQSIGPGAAPRRSRHPPSAPPPDPGLRRPNAAPGEGGGSSRGAGRALGVPWPGRAPSGSPCPDPRRGDAWKAAPLRPAPPPRSRGDNTGFGPGFNAQALPWQPELRARAGAASETPTGADSRGKHGLAPGAAPPAPAEPRPRVRGRLRPLPQNRGRRAARGSGSAMGPRAAERQQRGAPRTGSESPQPPALTLCAAMMRLQRSGSGRPPPGTPSDPQPPRLPAGTRLSGGGHGEPLCAPRCAPTLPSCAPDVPLLHPSGSAPNSRPLPKGCSPRRAPLCSPHPFWVRISPLPSVSGADGEKALTPPRAQPQTRGSSVPQHPQTPKQGQFCTLTPSYPKPGAALCTNTPRPQTRGSSVPQRFTHPQERDAHGSVTQPPLPPSPQHDPPHTYPSSERPLLTQACG